MATLLLIDDDPDLLRDRVNHVFPAPAHRVEIAQTGAEGLERVAAACPDVILSLRKPTFSAAFRSKTHSTPDLCSLKVSIPP